MPVEHHLGYVYGVRYFYGIYPQFIVGAFSNKWYSPRQTARCRRPLEARPNSHQKGYCFRSHNETSPGSRCRCGINMYNADAYKLTTDALEHGHTVALTSGWGKVVVQQWGYRVEKALLTLIFCPDKYSHDTIKEIPGFKKRGVELTRSKVEFSSVTDKLLTSSTERLTQIPTKEALHGNAR